MDKKNWLKSQLLSKKTKILIYKTFVRPLLTYTAETWTTKKKDKRRLSFSRGKSFAEYMVQYVREGGGERNK